MPKYIPLTSDFGFKRIFTSPDHPHILINFIETVIPELSIESVELLDTTQLQPSFDDRISIFDVYCTLSDGSFVIVEMQRIKQDFYIDRTLLYASNVILKQSQKGQWNYELPPIYVISVLNFRLTRNDRVLSHKVTLRSNANPSEVFYDKLKFIYLQLPNLTDDLGETHPLVNWLNIIRNLHKHESPMPVNTNAKTTRALIETMTLAEFESLPPHEQVILNLAQYAEAHRFAIKETAYKEGKREGYEDGKEMGIKEGIEKGMEEGRMEGRVEGRVEGRAEGRVEGRKEGAHQKALETAQNLLKMGLTNEQISQATGLPVEQITDLR